MMGAEINSLFIWCVSFIKSKNEDTAFEGVAVPTGLGVLYKLRNKYINC